MAEDQSDTVRATKHASSSSRFDAHVEQLEQVPTRGFVRMILESVIFFALLLVTTMIIGAAARDHRAPVARRAALRGRARRNRRGLPRDRAR